jgi:ATP-dependent DNA helicase DinG
LQPQAAERPWEQAELVLLDCMPEAVLKLKQRFGRLIRTRSNRGILVILDPRVRTKPYGRMFLALLPKWRQVVERV